MSVSYDLLIVFSSPFLAAPFGVLNCIKYDAVTSILQNIRVLFISNVNFETPWMQINRLVHNYASAMSSNDQLNNNQNQYEITFLML